MGDINYEKAEKEVEKAVQNTTVKSLVEGKTVKSSRAMDYYGIKEEEPRPQPEDRVERLMSELAAKDEDKEKKGTIKKDILTQSSKIESPEAQPTIEEKVQEEVVEEAEEEEEEGLESEFLIITKIPTEDTLQKARKQSGRTPKRPPVKAKSTPSSDKFQEPVSPLIVLRKHILWFKRLHMDDRYEKLGTTKEEVFNLRKARRLSDKELQRVIELNNRAEELKTEILKKSGKESLDQLIEKEQKRHKTKRFHTRETWLPL